MRAVLEKLVAGKDLTPAEAEETMRTIADGKADVAQTSAFLALLSAKGETPSEIAALAKVMREKATLVQCQSPSTLVDVVGTGGDGQNTLNFSTGAAILASACGVRVCKHGNRSASSSCGTADVLEVLGGCSSSSNEPYLLMDPPLVSKCVSEVGIAFMFAPKFHPAMKHVVPVRKALKIKTVFNIMGPLLNPAGAGCLMLGVYSPDLLVPYGKALLEWDGLKKALVVHCQGLDELCPIGKADAVEVTRENGVVELTIDPQELGAPICTLEDLKGTSSASGNAKALSAILRGEVCDSPAAHTVALNAGGALYVAGEAESLKKGYEEALRVLKTGAAAKKLDEWSAVAKRLVEGNSNKRAKR